jgi:ribose transport system substrate-binding protein
VLTPRPSSPRRTGRVVALLAVVALAAAACVPSQGEAASPTPTLGPTPSPSANPYDGVADGAGQGIKIGYLSYGEQVPYVFQISEGIRAQASLAGALLVECDAKLDATQVTGCMKKLSEDGIKGLIQFQGTLADPEIVCGETPAGVPVLAVEFAQPLCGKALVSADDLRAGQIAGAAVGQWVKEKWSCTYDAYISFESAVAADKSRLRMEGYRQGFTGVCGEITVTQLGKSVGPVDTEALGEKAMANVLTALPGKSRILVVAVNGDAALGALAAAKAAGREADVWVSGQGAEPKVRDEIRANEHYIGDAAYFPERFGSTVMPAILDLIAGKAVQPTLLIEPEWVDATNIDEVYPQ